MSGATWEVREGDALEQLREMPDESVQCAVTSPPYWGLRDYGVPGQLGLEPTPEEYVAKLVEVFREVRRVLRSDGTLWLNMGDSYAGSWGAQSRSSDFDESAFYGRSIAGHPKGQTKTGSLDRTPGLKPKDLCMIPARVAMALQADGWWLRSDIIWSKPNPMPESVQDRPTKAHEYVFLLTKRATYFYDAEAVAEPIGTEPNAQARGPKNTPDRGPRDGGNDGLQSMALRMRSGEVTTRNKRTVWTIATQPYPEAHFATFPPELPRICIKAGCPKGGVVLDPFAGAGTTGVEALALGRSFIGIELNPTYAKMARDRIDGDCPLFNREAY